MESMDPGVVMPRDVPRTADAGAELGHTIPPCGRRTRPPVFAPRHTHWAMFLTTVVSDVCPCTVKTALDLHKAGREPSSRS
ncbi:hypothetical protein DWC19_18830 [Streptomyces sp. M7]|nr:hypothetical protein DWC19_18830 [Streptomyces sp. M7]